MHRFFLPAHSFQGDRVIFPALQARQIVRVLRLGVGDDVVVLVDNGMEYEVVLDEVKRSGVQGVVRAQRYAAGEPMVEVALFVSLTQREKFEWILQKCTEAGVSLFCPYVSSRSLTQETTAVEAKYVRWNHILREAAEQSGRGRVPRLRPAMRFDQALQEAHNSDGLALIFWEGRGGIGLRTMLAGVPFSGKVSLFIGPEGGFSEEEIRQARESGLHPVSLGRRILRMETAALVASVLVLYELEGRVDQSSGGGAVGP